MSQHIHEEQIVDYVLGHLSAKEHFKVTAHLSSCYECTEIYNYWENVLETESATTPPASFWHRILANVNAWKQQTKFKHIYVTISVVAAIITIFTYGLFSNQQPMIEQAQDFSQIEGKHQNEIPSFYIGHMDPAENVAQHVAFSQQHHTQQIMQPLEQPVSRNTLDEVSDQIQPLTYDAFNNLVGVGEGSVPVFTHDTFLHWLETNSTFKQPIFIINNTYMCTYIKNNEQLLCEPIVNNHGSN